MLLLQAVRRASRAHRQIGSSECAAKALALLQNSSSSGSQDKSVSVRILKDGGRAPRLTFRFGDKFHAFGFQLSRSAFHIIRPESEVHLRAGLQTVIELEQHHACFSSVNAELNPALLVAERLVRENTEAKLLGIKGNGAVLVRDRDTH